MAPSFDLAEGIVAAAPVQRTGWARDAAVRWTP
jgi:hypothetical protein